jgi:endogenous inhibitor of DNA gyrase (YacG/DUF329 family)
MTICAECKEVFDPSKSNADAPMSFCSDSCQAVFTD